MAFGLLALLLCSACSTSDAAPAAKPARLVERSFFGMHVHWTDQNARLLMPPVGSIRLWDTRTNWAQLETAPGNWDFRRLDRFIELSRSLNADVVMTLGGTPRWAAAQPDHPGPYGPGSSSAPGRMSDWDTYVRTLAERYRGKIATYEILNEPKFSESYDCTRPQAFYCAPVRDIAALVSRSAAILKSVDPKTRILSPGLDGAGDVTIGWFADAGGFKPIDGVAFHFYAPAKGPALRQQIASVQRGVSGSPRPTLPIWNTEAGFDYFPSPGNAASFAAVEPTDGPGSISRQLIVMAAAGIARSYYYTWDDRSFGLSSLGGTAPTPNGDAYLMTMSWLLGARIAPCTENAGVWRCELTRDGRSATLAWVEGRRSGTLSGKGVKDIRFVQPLTGVYTTAAPGEDVRLSTEPTLIVAGSPKWGKMLSYVTVPR